MQDCAFRLIVANTSTLDGKICRVMRKPACPYAKAKGISAADQGLCFRIIESTVPQSLLLQSEIKALAILYGCASWFVSAAVKKNRRQVFS